MANDWLLNVAEQPTEDRRDRKWVPKPQCSVRSSTPNCNTVEKLAAVNNSSSDSAGHPSTSGGHRNDDDGDDNDVDNASPSDDAEEENKKRKGPVCAPEDGGDEEDDNYYYNRLERCAGTREEETGAEEEEKEKDDDDDADNIAGGMEESSREQSLAEHRSSDCTAVDKADVGTNVYQEEIVRASEEEEYDDMEYASRRKRQKLARGPKWVDILRGGDNLMMTCEDGPTSAHAEEYASRMTSYRSKYVIYLDTEDDNFENEEREMKVYVGCEYAVERAAVGGEDAKKACREAKHGSSVHYVCNFEGLEVGAEHSVHVQVDDVAAVDVTVVGGAAAEGVAFMAEASNSTSAALRGTQNKVAHIGALNAGGEVGPSVVKEFGAIVEECSAVENPHLAITAAEAAADLEEEEYAEDGDVMVTAAALSYFGPILEEKQLVAFAAVENYMLTRMTWAEFLEVYKRYHATENQYEVNKEGYEELKFRHKCMKIEVQTEESRLELLEKMLLKARIEATTALQKLPEEWGDAENTVDDALLYSGYSSIRPLSTTC